LFSLVLADTCRGSILGEVDKEFWTVKSVAHRLLDSRSSAEVCTSCRTKRFQPRFLVTNSSLTFTQLNITFPGDNSVQCLRGHSLI
jgi:hypothetical protein